MQGRALAVAIAFALLGVGALGMYTKRLRAEISGGEKIAVLVMAKDVKRNAPLAEDDLAVREIPIAYVDDRFVRASDKPKVLGLRLEHAIDAQQTLEWMDLALAGQNDRHLSQLVQPGTRALTLNVPAQYMSVELLRPGDYVDVIGILEEQRGVTEAIVLLQKVLVLAVGAETTANRDPTKNAKDSQLLTIAVSLQESQSIALAAQKGPVIAVLRSAEETGVISKIPSLRRVTPREPTPVASATATTAREIVAPQR